MSDTVTIVCCIENGRIEKQTLLMLESLRRWGGDFGRSRVLAVIPRRGTRLSSQTTSKLEALGVEVKDGARFNRMPWFNWYAKVAAALLAEEVATTPVVAWLDSDVLVARPPEALALPDGEDFAARREVLPPAQFSDSGPFRGYWTRACEVVGVRPEEIPWLPAAGPLAPQRALFNAGINAFRRGSGFVETYADCTQRMMKARLALADGNFWHNEQNAVTLAMVRARLNFRELPMSENHMVFQGMIDGPAAAPPTDRARLIHYSESMYPQYWPRFMERLRRENPELHEWLAPLGPIQAQKVPTTPLALARKVSRNLRYRLFARKCVRIP